MVCILGRTWTSLYIAGRKIEQFVTEGPYSVTRNPLYFFSILGGAGRGGAGAQLGSIVSGLVFGVLAWMVFYVVVLQEGGCSRTAMGPTSPATWTGSRASGPTGGCGGTCRR